VESAQPSNRSTSRKLFAFGELLEAFLELTAQSE